MKEHRPIQVRRVLREVEGYLELHLPCQALACLERIGDVGTFRGQARYLCGEALLQMGREEEAMAPLCEAADRVPSNLRVWTALATCYRRTNRLPLALAALEHAASNLPRSAAVQYQLACCLSAAGDKQRALLHLSAAVEMDSLLRDKLAHEPDLVDLQSEPAFQALLGSIA